MNFFYKGVLQLLQITFDFILFFVSESCLIMANVNANSPPQFQTLNKLWEFPIVNSAWNTSTGIYNRVREINPVITNALATAESTVQLAAQTAAPVAQRFQSPLSAVDQTLTRGLTTLEQRVPIVKAEPHVLYEGAKNFITSRVTEVRQNLTVRSLKDLAKEKANEVLSSRYGNMAFQGFSNSTFFAEQFIDHYLPLENDADTNSSAYHEVSALTTDQDRILFTIQAIGRIAGKLKRGVVLGVNQINRQAFDYLNRSSLMVNLAGYLRLVNEHLASQQSNSAAQTDQHQDVHRMDTTPAN